MSFEDPTQRLSVPPRDASAATTATTQTTGTQTTAALPRPLDLAGPTPAAADQPEQQPDQTGELSLAEIFDAPTPDAPEAPTTAVQPAPVIEDAPTWTAMPVVAVRSEPVRAQPDAGVTSGRTQSSQPEARQTRTKRTGPSTSDRVRADAAAAWSGAIRRSQAWLTRDDNGLMLMTAIVAIILILVVAAVGS